MLQTVCIVYASTSGHTEYVVDQLIDHITRSAPDMRVVKQRAELTKAEDFRKCDVLILASSTWNTGNIEGQLNPVMYDLLLKAAANVNLMKLPCTAIGLGDERYFYTAKAIDRLTDYLTSHGGVVIVPGLKIVNEPYGQEEKMKLWGNALLAAIKQLPVIPH